MLRIKDEDDFLRLKLDILKPKFRYEKDEDVRLKLSDKRV